MIPRPFMAYHSPTSSNPHHISKVWLFFQEGYVRHIDDKPSEMVEVGFIYAPNDNPMSDDWSETTFGWKSNAEQKAFTYRATALNPTNTFTYKLVKLLLEKGYIENVDSVSDLGEPQFLITEKGFAITYG